MSSEEFPSVKDMMQLCKLKLWWTTIKRLFSIHSSATRCLLTWQNFQRFYLYVLTENVKGIIMKHRNVLLSDEVKRRFGLNEREIAAAATLPELDDAYTRKIHNFASTNEMYKWSSCINYLSNIEKPIIFVNALDDPLVPEVLLPPIRNFAGESCDQLPVEHFNLNLTLVLI